MIRAITLTLALSLSTVGLADADVVTRLLEGNARFVAGQLRHPNQSPARLKETSGVQHPIAAVLGCSDSRVPPEILFDQGVGDLFVVREAGNVVDDHTLGSLEYAVKHLGVSVVLVVGHRKCGAVTAALEHVQEGHVKSLVEDIQRGLSRSSEKDPAKQLNAAIEENVKHAVTRISSAHPILAESIKKGTLKVQGAVYDVETGKVDLL